MSDVRPITIRVNRGLAWIGTAISLVGLLDIVAIFVILNNWIDAEEYGIATKAIWIFPILDQATDLGLSAAIVQRDDHNDARISTVFWINFGLSLALLGLLAIAAPLVATRFFGHEIVGWLLLAYGGKLVLQNIYFIPAALMKRELRFKELSLVRVIANLVEFAAKVGFAAAGFGIWCFVLGPLCRTCVYAFGIQARQPFLPKLLFRLEEARDYVRFGLKTSGSQIMFYFYTNIDYPIVGYYFGDVALGLYRLAYDFVLEPVRILSNIVVDIAFPAFARLRHSRADLIAQFISFTKLNLVIVMTYSVIVMILAPELVELLFPGFTAAVPAIRILGLVGVLRAVGFVVPPLLDGVGRPERTFRYMLTAAITMPLAFIASAVLLGDRVGYASVAIGWAAVYPLAFIVLLLLAVETLELALLDFVQGVAGVVMCIVTAALAGTAVHWVLVDQSMSVRIAATSVVIAAIVVLLLRYTQGITLRGILKGSRTDPP